jgi:hypothetical protein
MIGFKRNPTHLPQLNLTRRKSMSKFFVAFPALALMVALSANALAENGSVSQQSLQAMGLSSIQVMSDEVAMTIRGKGFQGGGYSPPAPPAGAEKPWTIAFGVSYAHVGNVGFDGWEVSGTGAGSVDGFIAEGKYMAQGEHYSQAGKTFTKSKELQVKGAPATLEITTKSIHVFAGGFATSSSL